MVGYKVPGSHATLNCTEDLWKVVMVIHRMLSGIKFNNMRCGEDTRIKIRTFMSFIFMVFERKKKKTTEKQNFKTENIQLYQLTLLHIQYCTRGSAPPMRVFCFAPVLPLIKCFGDVCLGHRNPILVPCDHGISNTCCLAGQVRFSSKRNKLLSLRVDSQNWGRVL